MLLKFFSDASYNFLTGMMKIKLVLDFIAEIRRIKPKHDEMWCNWYLCFDKIERKIYFYVDPPAIKSITIVTTRSL